MGRQRLCIMRRSFLKVPTMDCLISTAAAQATSGAAGQSNALMTQIPFLILMFVVFYFLLIRPQTKRAKEHRALIAALEVGAEVATNGGILGKVIELGEQYLTLEIADGVNIKIQRATVAQVLPKGTLKSL
jgi:preprotein translocase subunit YajC